MPHKSAAHLWDARASARLLVTFSSATSEHHLASDDLVRSAIERQFEVLGEALNRLRRDSPDLAARVPNIDRIVGMRNVIAHEYGEIDYEIVWRAATTDVPQLIPVLDILLGDVAGTSGAE